MPSPAILLLVPLAALLLAAAWGDLRRRIILNRLNLAIAAGAPLFWWAEGLAIWPDVAVQVALGLGLFAVFAVLFALGAMGGGDVKLIGALGLWVPLTEAGRMIVLTAWGGGVLALAVLAWSRFRPTDGRPEVPYGVAISAAAIVCLGQRYLYHFPS